MISREEIISVLKENKPKLFGKYPISELALFGSFARNDYNENSDIDILVDFHKPIDGFEYIRLAHEFEDIFNHKVDVVSRKAIKAQYLPFVESSIIYV